MTTSNPPESAVGWQLKIFFIVLLFSLLINLPARFLLGIGVGMGSSLGSDADSPFWSTGMVVTQVIEAVLHVLFVVLLVGALASPKRADRTPLLANWFSAFVLASLAVTVFGLIARLSLGYLQNMSYAACMAATPAAGVSGCYGGVMMSLGYAAITVAWWTLFLAGLTFLAKPAGGGTAAGDASLTQSVTLGAVAGTVVAVISMGASMGISSLYGVFSNSNMGLGLLFPLAYAVLDAAAMAVVLGLWRDRLPGQSYSGSVTPLTFN
jgi:hypothetical protein